MVDLNCDLGEGYGIWQLGDDEALLEVVTSANVACGFHAGDPSIMRRVCGRAAERGVAVGAQVSYPDRAGFGRRFIDMDARDLCDAIVYQVGALDALARVGGTRVTYVKCHGALYHATIDHGEQASAVAAAVSALDPSLVMLVSPGSRLEVEARQRGLATVTEAFLDRGYGDDGRLLPRTHPAALVTSVDAVVRRALQLVSTRTLDSTGGKRLDIDAGSLCVHSDTPGAATIVSAVRSALVGGGVHVRPFAPA